MKTPFSYKIMFKVDPSSAITAITAINPGVIHEFVRYINPARE